MTDHSAAPWAVSREEGGRLAINDATDRTIAEVVSIRPEADARLLAAAPAFLALAHYAVERGEGDSEMAAEVLNEVGCECEPCRRRHEWEEERAERDAREAARRERAKAKKAAKGTP